jgi:hypothetical protein
MSSDPNIIIDDIKKIIDENNLVHYTIKLGDSVRKNGSVPKNSIKTITWSLSDPTIQDEYNKIIYLNYNDSKTFLTTNKTPDQIQQTIQVYLNQNGL